MKVIALLPVRNEAWVLPHSLECLSAFCDVILVCDQGSDDGSRAVYARFPKVVVIDLPARPSGAIDHLPQHSRWVLLDAARNYSGCNLLWNTDADELIAPPVMNRWRNDPATSFEPRTFFACGYYHLWNSPSTYRDDGSAYSPQLKVVAYVDDRELDFQRSSSVAPLHEPRVPEVASHKRVEAGDLPVLHLQWLFAERNQMKQAWYRGIELLDGRTPAREINGRYACTLPAPRARTTAVPPAWVEGLTFPDFSIDREPSWHEREILAWFDKHGPEFFEPLEIWHVEPLRRVFVRRVGRAPRPDRSYRPPWHHRARREARRVAGVAWRRLFR